MRRIILLLICILVYVNSQASHFKSAEISLLNIKDINGNSTNNYKFQIKYYGLTNFFVNTLTVSIRNKVTDTLVANIPCILQGSAVIFNYPNSPCNNYIANTTIKTVIYESAAIDMSNYGNINNYYVTTTDITNGSTYMNIKFENNNNFLHYSEFPRLDNTSAFKYNSMPVFSAHPVFYACLNNMILLDYSATDIDGDSLVYSLVIPPNTSNVVNTYKAGYSANEYIKGNPKLTLDSKTGRAYLRASVVGNHFIAVKVEEYRGGQKVSEIIRQHEIQVFSSCQGFVIDQAPSVLINNQVQKKLNLNYSLGDTLASFDINVSDMGVAKDSLYIEIIDDNTSGFSFSNLDTSKFNWLKSVNGNLVKIGKYNFETIDTQNVSLSFRFKLYASLFNNLSGTYHLKVLIRDSKCAAANFDTTHITLIFNKKPTLLPLSNQSAKKGEDVSFKLLGTNLSGVSIVWQTDFGQGFQNIIANNNYSNVESSNITLHNVQLRNHQQKVRGIIYSNVLNDTSNVAELTIIDTTITNVYDTIYVRVVDTLFIKLLPLTVPPLDLNVIKIYPNPSNGKLFITCNSANQLQNYYYEISNQLGQVILNGDFNISSREIDLYTWGLKGLYHFNIRENGTQKLIESKKIVLE